VIDLNGSSFPWQRRWPVPLPADTSGNAHAPRSFRALLVPRAQASVESNCPIPRSVSKGRFYPLRQIKIRDPDRRPRRS
jgi:hypothetical protein